MGWIDSNLFVCPSYLVELNLGATVLFLGRYYDALPFGFLLTGSLSLVRFLFQDAFGKSSS